MWTKISGRAVFISPLLPFLVYSAYIEGSASDHGEPKTEIGKEDDMNVRTWRWLALCLSMALLMAASACSGGSDEGLTDGDQSPEDGDEDTANPDGDTDGDAPDGDSDGDVDGDADGDTDEPVGTGTISGTVHTADDLLTFNRVVALYDSNPFVTFDAQPVETFDITGAAGTEEVDYTFQDVSAGQYYLILYVDVNNNDDSSDDVAAVYPDKVSVVPDDPALSAGIDIYIGIQSQDRGQIAGSLYLPEAFRDKEVVVVAAEVKASGEMEPWPSAVHFTETVATDPRPFALQNLTEGKYHVLVFVTVTDGDAPESFISPYGPYEIKAGSMTHDGEVFYVDQADPNLGSVTGTITLAGAAPVGTLGVYLYDFENTIEPVSWAFVEMTENVTEYQYTVSNLVEQDDFWIAGFYQMDEDHISLDFWAETLDITSEKKDWTDIDFSIAVTELSGTISIASEATADTFARMFLWSGPAENRFGGGVDVLLPPSAAGLRAVDYAIYPAHDGTWIPVLAIDTDGNGVDPYTDNWCYNETNTITIDGSQLTASFNFNVDAGTCGAPPTGSK